MTVSLQNVTFVDNGAAVTLENVQNVTISNSLFKGNQFSGAITAVHSILSLMGNVTFIDNHSVKGGAISLFVESLILIPEPNNTYIFCLRATLPMIMEGPSTSQVVHIGQLTAEYTWRIPSVTLFSIFPRILQLREAMPYMEHILNIMSAIHLMEAQ